MNKLITQYVNDMVTYLTVQSLKDHPPVRVFGEVGVPPRGGV